MRQARVHNSCIKFSEYIRENNRVISSNGEEKMNRRTEKKPSTATIRIHRTNVIWMSGKHTYELAAMKSSKRKNYQMNGPRIIGGWTRSGDGQRKIPPERKACAKWMNILCSFIMHPYHNDRTHIQCFDGMRLFLFRFFRVQRSCPLLHAQ